MTPKMTLFGSKIPKKYTEEPVPDPKGIPRDPHTFFEKGPHFDHKMAKNDPF